MLHRLFVVLVPVVVFFLATSQAHGQIGPLDVNDDDAIVPLDVLIIVNPFRPLPLQPKAPPDYTELVERLDFLWGEYLAMNCPSPVITQLAQAILDLLDIADLLAVLGDSAGAEMAVRAAEQLLSKLESELTHLALTCEFAMMAEDAVITNGPD